MKKIIFLILIGVLLFAIPFGVTKAVHAEEAPAIEQAQTEPEETSASKYFSEKILPILIGASSSGVITSVLLIIATRAIRKAKKEFIIKADQMKNDAKEITEKNEKIMEENISLRKQVKRAIKMYDICALAFTNDPKLIANGTAKKIAEILTDEEKTDE